MLNVALLTDSTSLIGDTLGASVWHEVVKRPELNSILRDVSDAQPVWIPIAAHRSGLPSGPVKTGDDEIRMSLNVRAVPDWAPQPVVATVDRVEGAAVAIRTEGGELVGVQVSDETFIRDMNPRLHVPTADLQKIAFPGVHAMAMAHADGAAAVMWRNFY